MGEVNSEGINGTWGKGVPFTTKGSGYYLIAYGSSSSIAKDIYVCNKNNVWGLTENVLLLLPNNAVNFTGVIFLLVKETVAGSNLYSGYNVYGKNVFNNCIKIGFTYIGNVTAYYAPLDS